MTHPTPCSVGIKGSLLQGRAAVPWNWPLSTIQCCTGTNLFYLYARSLRSAKQSGDKTQATIWLPNHALSSSTMQVTDRRHPLEVNYTLQSTMCPMKVILCLDLNKLWGYQFMKGKNSRKPSNTKKKTWACFLVADFQFYKSCIVTVLFRWRLFTVK